MSARANPIAGQIRHVIGYRQLAVGPLRRSTFLNHGFNEDERGRIVWDGMNPNIAGMMGSFNIRFAQPGDIAELYVPGADGPLWWGDYDDTVRGRAGVGLLHRCTRDQHLPEDHGNLRRPGDLVQPRHGRHRGTTGKEDLPLPANVRRYYHAGTTHGGGAAASSSARRRPTRTLAGNPNPQTRHQSRALRRAWSTG